MSQQAATARDRQTEGKGANFGFLACGPQTRTLGSKAAAQHPKAPAGPVKPGRDGRPRKPVLPAEDVFPRGDNGLILFSRVGQGCAASGELWGLLGDFGTPGHQNTLLGDKISHLASDSHLRSFASSQPATHSGDPGGWGSASVCCWSVLRVRCPLGGPSRPSGERPVLRGRGRSHRGGPPVEHADMHASLQVLLEEVVRL